MSGVSNTPSVPHRMLPAPVSFPPIVVESTTGGTHVRIPRTADTIYLRKTLCGLSTLGWAHLYELDEFPRSNPWDIEGLVSCGRCAKAWEKQWD